jgi:uncharacterized protein
VIAMRTKVLSALVVLVPIAMYATFRAYRHIFPPGDAHLLGMVSYWVLLLVLSFIILGKSGVVRVVVCRAGLKGPLWLLLALPVVLAFGFGPFAKRLPLLTPSVVLLSTALALVNASIEELFWRGVYLDSFSNLRMACLFPALGFAIWHFAPLSVLPYNKGAVFFVLSAFLLGLFWGFVAFKTKSIGWNIVSHFLVDFSGFGALLYLRHV